MRSALTVLAALAAFAAGAGGALASHEEPAWDHTTGAGTLTAIVDSGIDLEHEDLSAKVVPGNTFLDCPQPDEGCGDGGWQSGPGTEGTTEGDPHGTHVAGIAGAITHNATGIAGVAPGTSLLAVR